MDNMKNINAGALLLIVVVVAALGFTLVSCNAQNPKEVTVAPVDGVTVTPEVKPASAASAVASAVEEALTPQAASDIVVTATVLPVKEDEQDFVVEDVKNGKLTYEGYLGATRRENGEIVVSIYDALKKDNRSKRYFTYVCDAKNNTIVPVDGAYLYFAKDRLNNQAIGITSVTVNGKEYIVSKNTVKPIIRELNNTKHIQYRTANHYTVDVDILERKGSTLPCMTE
jgi:lipoprotein|nr:MAG TPA: SurA N-terminal domain [Caudoviricetes sp.]